MRLLTPHEVKGHNFSEPQGGSKNSDRGLWFHPALTRPVGAAHPSKSALFNLHSGGSEPAFQRWRVEYLSGLVTFAARPSNAVLPRGQVSHALGLVPRVFGESPEEKVKTGDGWTWRRAVAGGDVTHHLFSFEAARYYLRFRPTFKFLLGVIIDVEQEHMSA